jgi:hypothetical protein
MFADFHLVISSHFRSDSRTLVEVLHGLEKGSVTY